VHTAKKIGAQVIAGVRGKELDDARSLGVSDVLAIDDDEAIENFRLVDAIADARLPGLLSVRFGWFGCVVSCFPDARRLEHPSHWKNTPPWHPGPATKVRILRFKNLPPFRHYRGLQDYV
jgi:hypothetical protein